MRVHIGKRDTLITFQRRTATQEAVYGTSAYTWANLASNPTEWADVQDILPSRAEDVMEAVSFSRRPCRVRTLYRSDITSDMRITFDSRTLKIVSGPAELGRRDGLEFICEEYTTEGVDP